MTVRQAGQAESQARIAMHKKQKRIVLAERAVIDAAKAWATLDHCGIKEAESNLEVAVTLLVELELCQTKPSVGSAKE